MTDPRTILGQARQGPVPVNWQVFTKKRGKLSGFLGDSCVAWAAGLKRGDGGCRRPSGPPWTRTPPWVVFDSSPNLNDADEQALYGHAHQRLAAHGRSA